MVERYIPEYSEIDTGRESVDELMSRLEILAINGEWDNELKMRLFIAAGVPESFEEGDCNPEIHARVAYLGTIFSYKEAGWNEKAKELAEEYTRVYQPTTPLLGKELVKKGFYGDR